MGSSIIIRSVIIIIIICGNHRLTALPSVVEREIANIVIVNDYSLSSF